MHTDTHSHSHVLTPIQISGCLIHSVWSRVRCWEGLNVLSLAWKRRCAFYWNVSELGCSVLISLGSLSNYYLTTLSHIFVEVTKPGRNKNGLGCTFKRSFVSPSWCAKVTIHNGCHYKEDKW